MTPEEFARYRESSVRSTDVPLLDAGLFPGPGKTLTLGYHLDRATMHVYVLAGRLHVVTYVRYEDRDVVLSRKSGQLIPASDLVPSKRAYPQHTDVRFAWAMRDLGHELTFTAWQPGRPDTFKGLL